MYQWMYHIIALEESVLFCVRNTNINLNDVELLLSQHPIRNAIQGKLALHSTHVSCMYV